MEPDRTWRCESQAVPLRAGRDVDCERSVPPAMGTAHCGRPLVDSVMGPVRASQGRREREATYTSGGSSVILVPIVYSRSSFTLSCLPAANVMC